MNKRIIFSSFVSNLVTVYSFTLYGAFSEICSYLFFPYYNLQVIILINCFGVFFISLVSRPLGGLFFGYIGDRHSRRQALTLSMYLMGFANLIIACLPPYRVVGVLAPILLITARILHGFSIGGEYTGVAIFALEHHVNEQKHGYISGIISASSALGLVLSNSIAFLLLNAFLPPWTWRLFFLSGSIMCLVGYYVSHYLPESPEFQNALEQKMFTSTPILEAIHHSKSHMLTCALIAGKTTLLIYILFTLIHPSSILLTINTFSHTQVYFVKIVGLTCFCLCCIISGYTLDKVKFPKVYLMISGLILLAISALPIFYFLRHGSLALALLAAALLGCFTGLYAGPQHAYIQELFPNINRYSAISFSTALGSGVLGGIIPQIIGTVIKKTSTPAPLIIVTSCMLSAFLLYKQHVSSLKKDPI